MNLNYFGKLDNFLLNGHISIELAKVIEGMNDCYKKEIDIKELTTYLTRKNIFKENFDESPIVIINKILELLSNECNRNTNWIESMFMIVSGCQDCHMVKSFYLRVDATEPVKKKLEEIIASQNLCPKCSQNLKVLPQVLIVELVNPEILEQSLNIIIQLNETETKSYELQAAGFMKEIKFKSADSTHWNRYNGQFTHINSNTNLFDSKVNMLIYVCNDNIQPIQKKLENRNIKHRGKLLVHFILFL